MIIKKMEELFDVVQFSKFYYLFSYCDTVLFYITQKNQIHMAFDRKLFLLHVLECQVCIIAFILYGNHLF